MPGGDKSGPRGQGPRTGRGAGYCAGYDTPGFANDPAAGAPYSDRGMGRGMGRGGGRGRGYRNRFYATGQPFWARTGPAPAPAPEQEIQDLANQANWLKEQLGAINQRLSELTNRG